MMINQFFRESPKRHPELVKLAMCSGHSQCMSSTRLEADDSIQYMNVASAAVWHVHLKTPF
jgi:hypothetical protein